MPKQTTNLKHLPEVAGVDEVGRGCLAGPVIAAAVILPDYFPLEGINDSKKMKPYMREELSNCIKQSSIWALGYQCHEEIDEINILQASLKAMAIAVQRLDHIPLEVFVDGIHTPPAIQDYFKIETVIKGDSKFTCIAAASIIAKVERDKVMRDYSIEYPEYGFENHFGYATQEHLEAIKKYGPCPIHRKTFSPIKEIVNQPCLLFNS